jgi:alpha-galactosidase
MWHYTLHLPLVWLWLKLRMRVHQVRFWCAADAMVSTGLAEQGYTYINIDDCWAALERDDEVPFDELPWS